MTVYYNSHFFSIFRFGKKLSFWANIFFKYKHE